MPGLLDSDPVEDWPSSRGSLQRSGSQGFFGRQKSASSFRSGSQGSPGSPRQRGGLSLGNNRSFFGDAFQDAGDEKGHLSSTEELLQPLLPVLPFLPPEELAASIEEDDDEGEGGVGGGGNWPLEEPFSPVGSPRACVWKDYAQTAPGSPLRPKGHPRTSWWTSSPTAREAAADGANVTAAVVEGSKLGNGTRPRFWSELIERERGTHNCIRTPRSHVGALGLFAGFATSSSSSAFSSTGPVSPLSGGGCGYYLAKGGSAPAKASLGRSAMDPVRQEAAAPRCHTSPVLASAATTRQKSSESKPATAGFLSARSHWLPNSDSLIMCYQCRDFSSRCLFPRPHSATSWGPCLSSQKTTPASHKSRTTTSATPRAALQSPRRLKPLARTL